MVSPGNYLCNEKPAGPVESCSLDLLPSAAVKFVQDGNGKTKFPCTIENPRQSQNLPCIPLRSVSVTRDGRCSWSALMMVPRVAVWVEGREGICAVIIGLDRNGGAGKQGQVEILQNTPDTGMLVISAGNKYVCHFRHGTTLMPYSLQTLLNIRQVRRLASVFTGILFPMVPRARSVRVQSRSTADRSRYRSPGDRTMMLQRVSNRCP